MTAETLSFSCHVSDSKASVVWKIKNFSCLSTDKDSMKFFFHNVKWFIRLQISHNEILFDLYSQLESADKALNKFRLQYYLRDRNGCEVCKFSKGPHVHDSFPTYELVNRWDLMHGKLGDLLPSDILTLHCVLEVEPNSGEEGSEKEPSDFILDALSKPFQRKCQLVLENGKFSDVTLRVGEETFRCHKAILSTHSEVFERMFDSDMKENREDAVDLTGIDVDVAKAMLNYIYTGHVEGFSAEKTLDLYVAADSYMLSELKEKCREFLQNHLSTDNICEIAEVAELISDDILTQTVELFLLANMRKILLNDKWKMRSHEKPFVYAKLLNTALLRNDWV